MTADSQQTSSGDFMTNAVDAAIRIGIVALWIAWCFQIVRPFLTPLLWGMIIAVAVHPAYARLVAAVRGREGMAATLLTIAMLLLLVGPSVYLSGLLVENVEAVAGNLRQGKLVVPPPPPSVQTWPLIGEPLANLWMEASENLGAALEQLAPQLKVVGGWLLATAAGVGLAILQFVAAVIIAGVLLARSATGHRLAHDLARRLAGESGSHFVDLAEATVRSVARGIIGVALIQSLLAAVGLILAGVPAAGLWALLCLILAVVQIGVGPIMIPAVIYIFSVGDTLTIVLFTAWSAFVTVIDNILRPLLLGRGVDVPMAVIFVGTIGGMLLSGIIGLFIGAVILALGYKLFLAWLGTEVPGGDAVATEP
jgi:predicted PurR-regulated permease PerM